MNVSHFPARSGRLWRHITLLSLLCGLLCAPAGSSAAQLDWDSVTWLPTGSLSQVYTGIAGGDIAVTIRGDTAPGNWYDGTPLIDQYFTGGLSPAENSLSVKTDYNTGSGYSVIITIDFSHAGGVSNVFFDLFDIDSDNSGGGGNDFTDRVEVEATNGSGTILPDTVIPSAYNALDGPNAIIGTADLTSTNTNQGNAHFGFSQSGITQVRITYSNEEGPRNTRIQFTALHDIDFTPAFIPPASGNKQLYLQTGVLAISRNRPAPAPATFVNHAGGGAGAAPVTTWDLDVATTAPLTITGANIPVYLWLTESGPGSWRQVRVRLYHNAGGPWTQIGVATRWVPGLPTGPPRQELFSVPNSITGVPLPAGTRYRLTIQNITAQANRFLQVYPAPAGGRSRVEPFATTVINVDSDATYEAPYPNVVGKASFTGGEVVSIRGVVSDPFGSADISSAQVAIRDPGGTPVAGSPFAMAELLPLTTAGTKTFEYNYTLPAGSPGIWTYTITALEGVEGTISHQSAGGFLVTSPSPMLVLAKTQAVQWDPINLAVLPKAIPGSYTDYTVELINAGTGQPDSESVFISDPIPANLQLFLGDLDGFGSPVVFTDFSSGLSYVFTSLGSTTDDVAFSDDGGATYTYDPTAPPNLPDTDADGFNSAITHIGIQPSGQMNASSGAPHPRFTARFRVRLD